MSRKSTTAILAALFVSIVVGVGPTHVRSSDTEMQRLRSRVAALEASVLRLGAHRGRVSHSPALVQPAQFLPQRTHSAAQSRIKSGKRRPAHSAVQSRILGGRRSIPKGRTGRRIPGRAPGIRPLPRASGEVPAGAVIAFKLDSCPRGWALFHEGRGRVIVGTWRGRLFPGRVSVRLLEWGGNTHTVLQVNQLPAHEHKFKIWQFRGPASRDPTRIGPIIRGIKPGLAVRGRRVPTRLVERIVSFKGGGVRPNNTQLIVKMMPPYIGLTLCEKRR